MPKNEISFEHFRVFSLTISNSLSKILKIVLEYTQKYFQLISSSDNKKILEGAQPFFVQLYVAVKPI
jgi:hypothetical protein